MAIDLALGTQVGGVSRISEQFGISRRALFRHKKGHLRPMLARALEGREYHTTSAIIGRLESLYDRAITLLDSAGKKATLRDRAVCLREVRETLELIGKCLGEFKGGRIVDNSRNLTFVNVPNLSVDELRNLAALGGDRE